jgi:DNA polymerase-3 subunit gamma/tau
MNHNILNQNTKISFTKKYRPSNFKDLIGQNEIIQILKNIIEKKINITSFLFYGERGCGKTSIARIFAKTINCLNLSLNKNEPCNICESCKLFNNQNNLDIIEIDAASNNSVENIRMIIENSKYLPQNSKKKLYIFDEVHMLSLSAFNALLKILEEPPEHIIFILITTEYRKIPLTVVSRCLRLQFKKLEKQEIMSFLKKICDFESIEYEESAIKIISELSEGAVRDALSLLESASIFNSSKITKNSLEEIFGIMSEKNDLFFILSNIFLENIEECFSLIDKLILNGVDSEFFIQNFIELINEIILVKQRYFAFEAIELEASLDKINFEYFSVISYISKDDLYNFFISFDLNLNFNNLYKILEVLNNSIDILNKNIYQNQEKFLKIIILKIYYSIDFSKNIDNVQNKDNKFNVSKEIESKKINNNQEKEKIFKDNFDFKKDDKIDENQKKNNDFNIDLIRDQAEEKKLDLIEGENFYLKLINFLKNEHNFLSVDLILTQKIKFLPQDLIIFDESLVPSKYLQLILKILRANFSQKWRIVLLDSENKNEFSELLEKERIFLKNFQDKYQERNFQFNNLYQDKKEVLEDKNKNISEINLIKKTSYNQNAQIAENKQNIRTTDEIKKEFLQSEIYKKFQEVFFISDNDIKIIK